MNATAITTLPFSYSKPCDTVRPRIGHSAAIRTGLGGKSFVYFFKPRAMLNSLVRQFCSEGRPACIKYRLRHAGLGELRGIYITYRDVIKLSNDADREFVLKIVSPIGDLCVDRSNAPLLVGSLRGGQGLFSTSINALRLNFLASRERGEVFQAKVNSDAAHRLASIGISNLDVDNDVQKPIPARVTREICAIPDLSFWERAAIEHPECISGEPESVTFALKITPLHRNPSKRTSPAIAQAWPFLLGSRFSVLLANSVDSPRMHAELFAAAARKLVQVKPSQPWASESQCVFLSVVAKIPDEIACPGLLIQKAIQRLNPITINKEHE